MRKKSKFIFFTFIAIIFIVLFYRKSIFHFIESSQVKRLQKVSFEDTEIYYKEKVNNFISKNKDDMELIELSINKDNLLINNRTKSKQFNNIDVDILIRNQRDLSHNDFKGYSENILDTMLNDIFGVNKSFRLFSKESYKLNTVNISLIDENLKLSDTIEYSQHFVGYIMNTLNHQSGSDDFNSLAEEVYSTLNKYPELILKRLGYDETSNSIIVEMNFININNDNNIKIESEYNKNIYNISQEVFNNINSNSYISKHEPFEMIIMIHGIYSDDGADSIFKFPL